MKRKIKKIINYTIQRYHSLNTQTKKKSSISDQNLFFLTGYDKSGTTWIKNCLNDVENISCLGSNQYFDFHLNSPESKLLHSIKENRIADSPYRISTEFYKNSFIQEFLQKTYLLSKKNAIYFGEKSTAQDINLIHYYFPQAKIVVLIRDLRDIIVSFAFHFDRVYKTKTKNWSPTKSKFYNDGTIKDSFIESQANTIKKYYGHLIALQNEKVIFIKYEDLISENGFYHFKEILSFIKSKSIIDIESHALKVWEKNSFKNLSKGRNPGEINNLSFYRSGTAGDYKNHFTSHQIQQLNNILGEELTYFGYQIN